MRLAVSWVCLTYACIRVHTNHLYAQKGKPLRSYLLLCENVLFHLYRMLFLSFRNNMKILYGVERNNIYLCKAAKLWRYVIRMLPLPLSLWKKVPRVFHLSAWLRWTCIGDTFVTFLSFPQSRSIPAIASSIASYFLTWKTLDWSVSFANSTLQEFFLNWIS